MFTFIKKSLRPALLEPMPVDKNFRGKPDIARSSVSAARPA